MNEESVTFVHNSFSTKLLIFPFAGVPATDLPIFSNLITPFKSHSNAISVHITCQCYALIQQGERDPFQLLTKQQSNKTRRTVASLVFYGIHPPPPPPDTQPNNSQTDPAERCSKSRSNRNRNLISLEDDDSSWPRKHHRQIFY